MKRDGRAFKLMLGLRNEHRRMRMMQREEQVRTKKYENISWKLG
jgi:hypothetical protein